MRSIARKWIYILGAMALAVVVFLTGIMFIKGDFDNAEESSMSSQEIVSNDDSANSTDGMGSGDGDFGGGNGGGGGDSIGEGGQASGENGNGDGTGPGDGSGGGSGGGGGAINNYLFRIYSSISETVYLREDNLGTYNGKGEHGFGRGYTYETPAGEIDPSEYFAYILQNNGVASHYIDMELKADLSRLYPYYSNKIYESDAGIMQYRARTYSFTYSAEMVDNLLPFSASYVAEDAYYEFVQDRYLQIPNTLKTTLLGLAEENNLNPSSATIISDVATYIQNAAHYDDNYAAKNYPDDKDMVTYFLTEHKRGVCRHFAAAATMMFRALGIPARYTIGFSVDVNAGEWLIYGDEPGEEGHAWTEVYIENYGWVAVEVTGSTTLDDMGGSGEGPGGSGEGPGGSGEGPGGSGEGPGDSGESSIKYDLLVRTPSVQKEYDGKSLKNTELQLNLEPGVRVVIESFTEITDVGCTENKIKIKLVDEDGKDCTGKIKYEYGTLTVTPKEIVMKTESKTASGVDSLTCQKYSVTGLVDGDYISLSDIVFARLDEIGVCTNTISYKSLIIRDKNGKDVTKNYKITMEFGTLILLP